MLSIRKRFDVGFTTRATLTSSTSIDRQELTCYSALRPTKTLPHLSKVARVLNFGTVAQHSERVQTYVDAHGSILCWQRFGLNHTTETRIPKTVLTFDGQRFNLAFDGAVQLDFDVANF